MQDNSTACKSKSRKKKKKTYVNMSSLVMWTLKMFAGSIASSSLLTTSVRLEKKIK